MTEPIPSEEQKPLSPTPFGQSPIELSFDGGCGRYALVGCGLLILLLGAGAVVFLLKADDFFVWTMGKLEAQVTSALPEDCTAAERERLRTAFAAAIEAVREGTVDPGALQEFMGAFNESLPDETGTLTREQVQRLTVLLERVAGSSQDVESSAVRTPPRAIGATVAVRE